MNVRNDQQTHGNPPTYGSATHWGAFTATVHDGDIASVEPIRGDTNPAPALRNLPGAIRHRSRIANPAVRRGWLQDGPGPSSARGSDEFVEVTWEELTELLSAELRRVIDTHGNEAIYGGSYGWASAGRFHHVQSQVHRFLRMLGGYTDSRNTYSAGASEVIVPHILGSNAYAMLGSSTTWDVIVEHTDLLVCFGGLPLKNTAVVPGGNSDHPDRDMVRRYRARGGRIVSISPIRDDIDEIAGPLDQHCRWYAPIPGTDVAVMLALAYVLITEDLVDRQFLDTHCTGYDQFAPYVLGETDGIAKTPQWAGGLSGMAAVDIENLARELPLGRTLIMTSLSLQRVEHGEQSVWMALTLAAMLGQIGVPGAGFGHGYGANGVGNPSILCHLPALPQGQNPVTTFIPVAAISELLHRPGEHLAYNGTDLTLPDIKLVYWAGGNPFHHHQNIPRLRRGLNRVDTVVVHEIYWTAMAKHADIVIPSTSPYERDDIAGSHTDPRMIAMQAMAPRYANARDDYDIFAVLAERLGFGEQFTEGRDSRQWLEHMYNTWSTQIDFEVPAFAEFWRRGHLILPTAGKTTLMADFRADPNSNPLPTQSGRVEIFSRTIDSFDYDDCPGHPTWLEPTEWLQGPRAEHFPLHLIANQPRNRLHSQLDHGAASMETKVQGREPIRIHPEAAAERGISDGDIVRVFNDRGACLAGAVLHSGIHPRVAQLPTGAWYDPLDPADPDSICVHGNPNVLTNDVGTSQLAHGCTGQHALIQIEKHTGPLPALNAHQPPRIRVLGQPDRGVLPQT